MAQGKQFTRRRTATRERLLDAAFEVFAAEGFGRATVEQVCAQAGFTRGAFYSNFTSLDELFLAMWEQKSKAMVTALREVAGDDASRTATTVREAIERALSAVPLDDAWFRVSAEFTAHALRTPGLRRVIAAREAGIQAALLPVIEELLAATGRQVVDREALGQALVAVHDGTLVQCLVDPDGAAARRRRTDLFVLVVEHHTQETSSP